MVRTFYGKMQALWDVSLDIGEAEIVALIGANGAGKTTLLKTITGVVAPRLRRDQVFGPAHRQAQVPRYRESGHLPYT